MVDMLLIFLFSGSWVVNKLLVLIGMPIKRMFCLFIYACEKLYKDVAYFFFPIFSFSPLKIDSSNKCQEI